MEIYTARSLRGAAGSWSSGYDIALTQRRSPVRIRSSPFLSAGPGHGVREPGYGGAEVGVGAATATATGASPPGGVTATQRVWFHRGMSKARPVEALSAASSK